MTAAAGLALSSLSRESRACCFLHWVGHGFLVMPGPRGTLKPRSVTWASSERGAHSRLRWPPWLAALQPQSQARPAPQLNDVIRAVTLSHAATRPSGPAGPRELRVTPPSPTHIPFKTVFTAPRPGGRIGPTWEGPELGSPLHQHVMAWNPLSFLSLNLSISRCLVEEVNQL